MTRPNEFFITRHKLRFGFKPAQPQGDAITSQIDSAEELSTGAPKGDDNANLTRLRRGTGVLLAASKSPLPFVSTPPPVHFLTRDSSFG